MNRKFKKTLLAALIVAMLCILFATPTFAGTFRKCYTILNNSTTVYSNTSLSKKYGTIYGSDEITVITVTGTYSKVTYPISGGRTKTGYIKTSSILTRTTGQTYTSKAKITTYRRPGGVSYGYIGSGDKVVILGAYGSYTQIKYPVSGGYKYGFVTTDNANRYISGSNSGSSSISNGMYTISTALKNNMVMDVYDGRSSNGTNIQIYQSNGGNNQKYNVTAVGSGWYRIINVATNKAVDVTGGVRASNVNVQLYDYNGSDAQLWRFISAGNGYYYIQNKLGYYLDVYNNQTSNETNIIVYQFNGGNNQKWKFAKTSTSTSDDLKYWDGMVGKTAANIGSTYYTTGNISYRGGYKGQCTWYAYGRFYEVNGIALKSAPHAKYWISNNRKDSRVSIVSSIKPKSIAVRTTGKWGHVMFIENVTYSGATPQYVFYTECNDDGNGRYDIGKDCIVKKLPYSTFCSKKKPAGYIVKR